MKLGEARVPDGLRVYAIGDVHGCDHLLAEMHQRIHADLAVGSPTSYRVIHLGDYVDRGPDTRGVIDRVSRLEAADANVVCLRGNHEEMLLDFLAAREADAEANFLANGGVATLASYGIAVGGWRASRRGGDSLATRLAAQMPSGHRAFLENLPYSTRLGDFFFCHAGVRPGVDLAEQDPFDLTWIRNGFLNTDDDFGAVVVHGHTPHKEPEFCPNRINIDTGAVLGGPLTCVVLEGRDDRILQVK